MVPLVSVIIPTYQCGHLLARAIDSALAQTYPSVEIIVVNDGSTDNTDEIVQYYIHKIIYIKQENKGVSSARNIGIRQASGKYIAFLDADDYYLPERLKTVMEVFQKETDCFVTTDFYVEENGQISDVPKFGRMDERFKLSPLKQFEALLIMDFIFVQVVIPRSILDDVGLFDESLHYCEDWDLWLRCTAAGYKALFINVPLSVYMGGRPGSLTSQRTLRKAQDTYHIFNKYKSNPIARPNLELSKGSVLMHTVKISLADRKYFTTLINALKLAGNISYLRKVIVPGLFKRSKSSFFNFI